MDVINKITAMFPPTSKKETHAFLGIVGFWKMRTLDYSALLWSLTVNPSLSSDPKEQFHMRL